MKRGDLRHLRHHGCTLKREAGSHSLWMNPRTGVVEAVPRHYELSDQLARRICRNLSVPEIGREGARAVEQPVEADKARPG